MSNLLVLVLLLPFVSAIATAVLGPRWLRKRSHVITVAALVGAFGLSLVLTVGVWRAASSSDATQSVGWSTTVSLWTWVQIEEAQPEPARGDGTFRIAIDLRLDALSAVMLNVVLLVASLVAIYSVGYMHGDRGYWRFFAYVSLFVFSMAMLVTVSNFVLLYVFWEAVGLCSYLLIGFWYDKPAAAAAGKKAFLVNRVGDFGFALALFFIWTVYGTLNFHDQGGVPGVLGQTMLSGSTPYDRGAIGISICLLLMLGACGKSAQFPLHVWLPDAMEGPTPVSALIHAATMVTAGIYMVARCSPLFVGHPQAQLVVASIGAFTALMAALIALTQNDLKRVLAYSTISQLGYMFLALGTGTLVGITAAMFHLFTHAFFKALLFLGAGSVMHAMGGVIDMRRFGGLRRAMPVTFWTFLIGGLALAGVPPLSGFFSKDTILAEVHAAAAKMPLFDILYGAALVTAFLTAVYTFRAFGMTFLGSERIPPEANHHAHESPRLMTVPLVILGFLAVVAGALAKPFAEFLATTPSLAYVEHRLAGDPHTAHGGSHTMVAIVSSVIAVAGIGTAMLFYGRDSERPQKWARALGPFYALSHGKFFFDPIYSVLVVWPCRGFAALSYAFDRYVVDGIVNLIGMLPRGLGIALRGMQTGMVQLYALLMVLGVLALMGSLMW